MKLIIYNPATNLFDFFIDSLKYEFNKKNIYLINYSNNIDFDTDNPILIIVNPHFIFDYKDIHDEIMNISKIFRYKILYLTEPINFIIEKKVYNDLIKLIKPYSLWTYSKENFNKLNSLARYFKVFPNYNESYNFIDLSYNNLKARSLQNILFIGNITDSRSWIKSAFSNLINITNSWNKEEWINIINNHLFYLNIHRRVNCKSFESFRIIPLLANGSVIFSEYCNESEMEEYKDYNIIFCSKEDLYTSYINYIKNIDYDEIFRKALLFRSVMTINKDLDNYINYHNSLSK
jgi:hypothetical protein